LAPSGRVIVPSVPVTPCPAAAGRRGPADVVRAALDGDQLDLPDQPGQPCGGGTVGQDDGAVLGAHGDMGHGFTFTAPIAIR
jgi:hypothetical protein